MHFLNKMHCKSPTELSMEICQKRKCSATSSDLKSSTFGRNKTKQIKLQNFIDNPLIKKNSVINALLFYFIFWLVGVSKQWWIGKCSKDEVSRPAPLKVLFLSKITTFHSCTPCTTLKKTKFFFDFVGNFSWECV